MDPSSSEVDVPVSGSTTLTGSPFVLSCVTRKGTRKGPYQETKEYVRGTGDSYEWSNLTQDKTTNRASLRKLFRNNVGSTSVCIPKRGHTLEFTQKFKRSELIRKHVGSLTPVVHLDLMRRVTVVVEYGLCGRFNYFLTTKFPVVEKFWVLVFQVI